jgi:transcriptional regulator with AAA-type ATPase domain
MAIDLCDDSTHKATYQAGIDRCDAAAAVDRELASIAKRILQIPTLETRKSDQLDFHEVGVWSLQEALRLAYRLHRDAP